MTVRTVDQLIANLVAGARLALGLGLRQHRFLGGARVLAASLAAYWILLVLAARLAAGPGTHFDVWGLLAAGGRFHLWVTIVLLIAWLGGAHARAGRFALALLNGALPIALVAGSIRELAPLLAAAPAPRFVEVHMGATAAWAWLVFWRAAREVLALTAPRAVLAGALYAGTLALLLAVLPRVPLFDVYRPPPPPMDIEAVYYRQEALLDAAVSALAPQDPESVDLYYVGVAPFSTEDVFVREIEAARDIAEQRLGLAGRTLTLVNHPSTLASRPLANVPNLRQALAALGRHIDRDHDIVFVYLTSHGHEHAALAADFPPLAPNDIHAHELRAALDDARILWRVVVVSACFSGSFIEQLRSPTTLVVTAAAADRASFGCSHENDWTYFGEAFFADALARTADLVAAAEAARATIAAREARERRLPSRPQIVVGAQIGAQLARWRQGAAR